MKALLCLVPLALAACNASPVATDDDNRAVAAEQAREKATQVLVPNPKPVTLESETPLLHWKVSWPAEVSAYPTLEKSIRAPAEKAQAELGKQAAEDKAERAEQGFPWPGAYESTSVVKVAGQTPRLLSLTREWTEYTGGAHPMHGTEAILWDRQGWRRLSVFDLFTNGEKAFTPLVAHALCAAANRERAEKRGPDQQKGEPDDPFYACPEMSELAIIPKAGAGGVFTTLTFHADPYVLGPYAEGDYDIDLPVTAAMIAAMKPEYRASFAAA